jgi:antitoxin MazE
MATKVLRWGHGLGIRIPLSLARRVGLEDGSLVELRLEDGRIAIEPLPTAPTLRDLLSGVTAENRRDEFEWWPADGRDGRGP